VVRECGARGGKPWVETREGMHRPIRMESTSGWMSGLLRGPREQDAPERSGTWDKSGAVRSLDGECAGPFRIHHRQ
jgi:hypothetical protein